MTGTEDYTDYHTCTSMDIWAAFITAATAFAGLLIL